MIPHHGTLYKHRACPPLLHSIQSHSNAPYPSQYTDTEQDTTPSISIQTQEMILLSSQYTDI